jgi:hypothetical protein
VYDAVADSVGKRRVTNFLVPTADIELRAKYGRGFLVSGFRNFKKFLRLRIFKR